MSVNEVTTASRAGALERWLRGFVLLLAVLLPASGAVWAQGGHPRFRCPEGEYKGPDAGKSSYVKDPYVWFVTKDFAERFCMPKEFIAPDLEGAEAIAFRYKPSEFENCSVREGVETCRRQYLVWLELYVKSTANIPKYEPAAGFFVREPVSSGSLISNGQALKNADRRRTTDWVDPLGRRAPFFGANKPDGKPRTTFSLLGVKADGTVRFRNLFYEEYYQQNWVDGIDLIAVANASLTNPQAIQQSRELDVREAIGVLSGYLGNQEQVQASKKRLEDFPHVIKLPRRLTEIIRDIDARAYEQRFPFAAPASRQ